MSWRVEDYERQPERHPWLAAGPPPPAAAGPAPALAVAAGIVIYRALCDRLGVMGKI